LISPGPAPGRGVARLHGYQGDKGAGGYPTAIEEIGGAEGDRTSDPQTASGSIAKKAIRNDEMRSRGPGGGFIECFSCEVTPE
jgi:hypothetical protein